MALAPPNNPPGRVHTAGGRATCREMCRDMFPLLSDYTHIGFLLDLLLQLLLKLLLLSRSAHGHAVRLKIPHPQHKANVPTIELPSRGFSCCCTSQPPQGYHPPCVQLRLHHRKVPTMVWYSTPPCCTGGGRRLMPTGRSFCLAFDAGLHLNQLIESKALLQCPRP